MQFKTNAGDKQIFWNSDNNADDHEPPHFHARYGEHEAMIQIDDGEIVRGSLPRHALRLVQDWAELHKQELQLNFKEAQKDDPEFKKIEPLDK